ncbi:MAG: hypothetical protein OEV36_01870 [Myxococcales bacterium]|nr:hypothetical protein [Myxococcales bacterium]
MSEENTTIVETGLGRLLDQFKGSVNLKLLLQSYLQRVQDLEAAAYPLYTERSLANATGDRLDRIGQLFGITRGGRDDTAYRLAITTELAILFSRGTEVELLNIVQLVVQMPTADYDYVEYYPKTVYLRPVNYPISAGYNAQSAKIAVARAASAGTRVLFVYAFQVDSILFTLSSLPSTVQTSPNLGLANDTKTTGGHLSWAAY